MLPRIAHYYMLHQLLLPFYLQQASIHHIFHQHLDICWYMLEILHTLTTQAGTAGSKLLSVFHL